MKKLALFLIGFVSAPVDREWIVGDTIEEFERIERFHGPAAARRWLRRELCRVLVHASRHRLAGRRSPGLAAPARGDGPMSAIWQDVRYALRVLRRSPGFTAVAVLTLALGIGANTAMFAVVHAVLLKPLPFLDPERLMLVHRLVPDREAGPGVYREGVWSYPKYRTFLDIQRAFTETALFARRDYSVAGDGQPERVQGEVITDRYPAILGISPILGRAFTREEAQRAGSQAVAMIGHGLWTRRYGGDPAILGRNIQVNGSPYTVVGVLPRGFRGLNGNAELWTPLAVLQPEMLSQLTSHSYGIVARRRAEVSEEAAVAATRVDVRRVDEVYRDEMPPFMPRSPAGLAVSLSASRADADIRRVSWVVLGAVGFVLLIACVNLTNLLAARAIGRRRELAIRVAIGASRGRIARQLSVEGLLLAGLGAIGGLAVASVLLSVAAMLLPDSDVFFRMPMAPGTSRIAGAAGLTRIGASMIGLDVVTLLFTCGVTIVTAVLVALMPAVQGSALRPLDALKTSGSSGTARGLHAFGGRSALVATQIALALVLLAGAGLMVRSAARLQATGIGVVPDRVLTTARIELPDANYTSETGTTFFAQLVERVRAVPGVESVGLGNCAPVSGGCHWTSIELPSTGRAGVVNDPMVGIYWATPDYFPTLGIRLQRGRTFTGRDRAGQPKVVLVNEAAVRAFWPRADPLGQTIAVGAGGFSDGATVIGVVSDVRYRAIETAATPDVYVPLAQSFESGMRLFVRSHLDTGTLVTAIRRELRALDPHLPLSGIKTMDEQVGDAMWRTRVSAWLLSAFAALALLLTAIGVFGVMAQTVMQRTAEIGIRMALGAQRRDVVALVLGRAVLVAGAGLMLGIGCALGLTRLITTLLYDVEPNDPVTFVSVVLVVMLVALAACYIPVRRATRVDAIVALRSE
ncbi:MAG: FtsX-like permease family protein [Luteitalea sp.]|nr:FtsX-like permease family protein [Luteitalea sp.]